MSLCLPFVNPPHQQHVISDCGVCLWLMLRNRRNNKGGWEETGQEGDGERVWEMGAFGWNKGGLIKRNKRVRLKKKTYRRRMCSRLCSAWSYFATNLKSLSPCGPFWLSLVSSRMSLPVLVDSSFSLSLSSPSREAGSPDPVWKSATHIPPQSTLLWESQARRDGEQGRDSDRESLLENERWTGRRD